MARAPVIGLLFVALVAATAYHAAVSPGPATTPTTLVIAKGASVAEIARQLKLAQVISSPLFFRAGARLGARRAMVRAGEYAFTPQVSLAEVLTVLRRGQTVARKLTVPEGMTSRQVLDLLRATAGLAGEVGTPPVEGTLLPETYHYGFGDRRDEFLARMAAAAAMTLAELWAKRAPDLPLKSPHEAVTLASIVEKETSLPEERSRIAAVFINRLKRGMRLQADPTVAYALVAADGGSERPLTLADLQSEHAYNTYVIDGLPPGPIANPGRAALAAVLQPAATDELYFVADGSGGHAFARTLEEHNRNVANWRRMQRQNGAASGSGAERPR